LVFVKKRFTEVTREQVTTFIEKLAKLQAKFERSGPGCEDVTLDAGLELLVKVKASLERYGTTRDDLSLAEKLFSLPITSYPVLSELEGRVRDLSQVYDVYSQFRDAVQTWSSTQWSALDINVLVTGVESFSTKLRRLPKQAQSTAPFRKLSQYIASFGDSIPLIRDLKSDALRPRHWQKIQEITGKSFGGGGSGSASSDAKGGFTLDTVFKMELNRFSEQIAEVTSGAAHELTIESTLQSIAAAW
jgi:dynein heavy chain